MKKMKNALEALLFEPPVRSKNIDCKPLHQYEKGMFISINNHKSTAVDIISNLKRQYQSILYVLHSENYSREPIKVVDRVPKRENVMRIIHNRGLIMVAAIHNYNHYNHKVGRGSSWNANYQHLHLYLYGIHKHMPGDDTGIANTINYLKKILLRHNKIKKSTGVQGIDIKPVGYGKYQYNDIIEPTTLYDYLQLPKTDPSKHCVINYMADTNSYENNNYNLLYIYKEQR